MGRPFSFLLATLLVTTPLLAQELPSATPETVGMSSERLGRITEVFGDYVNEGRLAGASIMVVRDGSVVYSEALGDRDRESGSPMATDDIFRIASQTKALVSVGIMMLQEEGKLLISDPVSRYLPSFRNTTVAMPRGGGYDVVPSERPVTLRHLLTHTAGIAYGSGPGGDRWEAAGITGWYFGHRDEPIRSTVDRMSSLPFQAQPGERFVYGYNTDILGAVIEVVSGQTLDVFVRERILEPLDMHDTHFYLPPGKRERLAVVYGVRDGTLTRGPDGPGMQAQGQYVDGPRASFSGGAGLLSTTRDYARFLQMLLNGGELNGVRLLSPTTVDLMTQNHVGDLGSGPGMGAGLGRGFGLGFAVREDVGEEGRPGSVGDFGWLGAYHSIYWVDPVERLVVVYLTQLTPTGGLDDQLKLRSLVYGAIVRKLSMHEMMH
jgi:CubicO group peptidase (beta-lactamase class C family)